MKLLFLFSVIIVYVLAEEPCFDAKRELLERHFSTKTPYRVVANRDDKPVEYPGCKAVRNWAIIRHGTRNPSAKTITKMKNDLYRFRDDLLYNSRLCKADRESFWSWACYLNEDQEKILVPEGEDEMIDLAERFQLRFPHLLSDNYDNSTYKFKFTATERTETSAKGFATGLFGRDNLRQIWFPKPLHKDPVLRFYKLCPRWRTSVNKNQSTYVEIQRFENTPLVREFVEQMRFKTGIPDLNFEDLQAIYETCAFETAWWKNNQSPWCTVLDRDSIRILEFAEDLEYYWKDGYGHELTHNQACPAIKDMIDHLRANSTYPPSTFYFTHSGTILKMLAALGLYRDRQPLKHQHFDRERLWKTSQIDAFGSNLMFVMFHCGPANDEHILTMHQERIVRLPGCSQDLCPLESFQSIYRDHLENCHFNEICQL